jgi:hypothetical protein
VHDSGEVDRHHPHGAPHPQHPDHRALPSCPPMSHDCVPRS